MSRTIISYRSIATVVSSALVALFIVAAPAFSGVSSSDSQLRQAKEAGGNVLPARAEPRGYSLYGIAKTFAPFNTSDHAGAPPNLPFQALYWSPTNPTNTFNVRTSTMLYVPIIYNDDSLPVIGDLPDVTNRNALVAYFYSSQQFGAAYTIITVDGKDISLGSDYLIGVGFPTALPDAAHNYMTVAAFLTPLKKGTHTVGISAYASGDAFKAPPFPDYFPGGIFQFSVAYTVNVY